MLLAKWNNSFTKPTFPWNMGSQFPSKKLQIEVRSLYGRYNLTYLCSFQAQKAKAGASKGALFWSQRWIPWNPGWFKTGSPHNWLIIIPNVNRLVEYPTPKSCKQLFYHHFKTLLGWCIAHTHTPKKKRTFITIYLWHSNYTGWFIRILSNGLFPMGSISPL